MNHLIVYNNLILKAKNEKRTKGNGIYYENHHIIPRCIDGSDTEDNKVLLTGKEHYVAHKLLTYIYPNNRKIILALHMMTHITKNFELRLSSRDYSYLKELVSKNGLSDAAKLKVGIFNKGKILSENTKNKQRLSHLGNKNPMYGKSGWAVNKLTKQCPYCDIKTTLGNYGRWHGEKCKHKL